MVDIKTKKMIASVGIGIAGYHAINMNFPNLPAIPGLDNTMILAAAGAVAIWSIFMLWNDY